MLEHWLAVDHQVVVGQMGRSAGGKKTEKDKQVLDSSFCMKQWLQAMLNAPSELTLSVIGQADEERAEKYPNLTTPHTLKALQAISFFL